MREQTQLKSPEQPQVKTKCDTGCMCHNIINRKAKDETLRCLVCGCTNYLKSIRKKKI